VEQLSLFQQALELYRARRFEEAESLFQKGAHEHADAVAERFVTRCQLMRSRPPPEDWDGSFALTEK
jgi:adenylate cyclase